MFSHRSVCFCLTFFASTSVPAFATDFHVYYLGGQSNMDGFGYVEELPEELRQPVDDVPIFHGNMAADDTAVDGRGVWATVRPGHGTGFTSDGKANNYSNRFGVEVTFAHELKKQFPDRRIAIIKYSRGGTSIAQDAAGQFGCWEPDFKGKNGVNQYDHFLATVRGACADADIDDDGTPDRLIPAGIVWMQGESDAAYSPEIAEKYEANLKRLMDLIRAAFRADDLPVVIGRISYADRNKPAWVHGEIVRQAQADFAKNDANAALVVSTDEYGYSDPWHYDSAGYVDLGRQFADALVKLEADE
ncbi:MAG: sialate O-acetylesterase [Planctomycetaceae bacterium]